MNKTCPKDTVLPYEQDPTRGHKLSPHIQWLHPPKKEPRAWIRIQCTIHLPKKKNLEPLDPETKLIPAAEDRTPSNNHT